MNKFLKDLGEGLSWIWMTPDEARRLLGQVEDFQRGITFERTAKGAFAKAA